MNLHHLELFHAVAHTGNVTAAAKQLHISQPAVSVQIRELEEALDTLLFERQPRGVLLTEAGGILDGYASRLFAIVGEAEVALAAYRSLEQGRLRVGASTTIGGYLLPSILGCFHARYPAITLGVEIQNTERIHRLLADGLIDIGLTEGSPPGDSFEVQVFARDALVVLVPPGHPLTRWPLGERRVEALRSFPFLSREAGSGSREVVEQALLARGLRLEPAMSLGSTEALKNAVAAGLGIAVVSALAVEKEVALGRVEIVAMDGLSISRPLHRVTLRGRPRTPSVGVFEALLGGIVMPESSPCMGSQSDEAL